MISVSLIWFGKSGWRFLQVLLHRQHTKWDIKINAVCDSNPDRLSDLKKLWLKTFSNLNEMFDSWDSEIFIVSTNEDSHFDIISEIKKNSKKYKKIIVEKLLVENIEQAEQLLHIFQDHEISINFVERHSIIIEKFKKWIHENDVYISRASFKRGKYRLHDSRPTVGVLSEISHPLDLILMLSDTSTNTSFRIINWSYTYSDYSNVSKPLLDSIDININFDNGLNINGWWSFLWDSRERKIILFLSNKHKMVQFMVVLEFDKPHRDIDKCIIYDIWFNNWGERKVIKTFEVKKEQIEPEVLCVSKILNLITENIKEIKGWYKSNAIAHLEQWVYIQKIIEQLKTEAEKNNAKTEIFGNINKPQVKKSTSDKLLYEYLQWKDIKEKMVMRDEEF